MEAIDWTKPIEIAWWGGGVSRAASLVDGCGTRWVFYACAGSGSETLEANDRGELFRGDCKLIRDSRVRNVSPPPAEKEADPHDPLGDGSVTLWTDASFQRDAECGAWLLVDGVSDGYLTSNGVVAHYTTDCLKEPGKFPRRVWNPAHKSIDFAALRDRVRAERKAKEPKPKDGDLRYTTVNLQQYRDGEWRDVPTVKI